MDLYSVLLVDDEEEVIEIIIKKMDWESLGFQVAGYAHNGLEALEMAEELLPDVVMTDIKMPYMDGLTLSRKLKELYQTIKIIIFSGFDEFEYAKEAIRAEVEEYLLKPVNIEELSMVFSRIRKDLDREKADKYNLDKLRSYYRDSLPVLQENFFTSLAEGRISKDRIPSYLKDYQLTLEGPCYIASVLHVSSMDYNNGMDSFLMTISVQKLAEEQLCALYRCRIMQYLDDILIFTELADSDAVPAYTDTLDNLCRLALRIYNARVTAGIGQPCQDLSEFSLSYNGAKTAVSYRALYGYSKAYYISEINPQEDSGELWEEKAIRSILKRIQTADPEGLEKKILLCEDYFRESGVKGNQFRIFIFTFLTELTRFCSNNHINMENIFGKDTDLYSQALSLENPQDLGKWLHQICNQMMEVLSRERQNITVAFVSHAVDYIHDHFGDQDITLEFICRYLNVSSAYFSTIFKKETGKTFISYLTDYRMEQACQLLKNTDEKTYIIADQVGYSDANYFSYVFKKQFGMSPSRYRGRK